MYNVNRLTNSAQSTTKLEIEENATLSSVDLMNEFNLILNAFSRIIRWLEENQRTGVSHCLASG